MPTTRRARVPSPASTASGACVSRRSRGNALTRGAATTAHREHPLHALTIAHQHGVVDVELLEQQAREAATVGIHRHTVVDPMLLAEALEQPAVVEKLEVPRHPRLALAEDLGELGNREFTTRQDGEQSQTRRLGDGPQTGQQGVEGLGHGL